MLQSSPLTSEAASLEVCPLAKRWLHLKRILGRSSDVYSVPGAMISDARDVSRDEHLSSSSSPQEVNPDCFGTGLLCVWMIVV